MEKQGVVCQVCSAELAGRIDKKFCSDQCRAQLNNRKKKADAGEKMILDINRILRKNRSILKISSPLGKTTTRQEYLKMQGFNLNHYTHQYKTNKGSTYNFCYDYGYLLLPEEKVLIVNWQDYMKAQ